MKIFFIDDEINHVTVRDDLHDQRNIAVVDAIMGYNYCINQLDKLKRLEKQSGNTIAVYTNFICALSNKYVWDEENDFPELYIRKNKEFKHATELTDKEIRFGHNLEMMYRGGGFNV